MQSAAERLRIFEPFVRLDDTKEREEEGYGLGLTIVRRVAQWHGGQVMVEDAPIGGARFTLRWPQIQQASDAASIRLQTN